MTKADLIKILENYTDNQKILIFYGTYVDKEGNRVGQYADLKYIDEMQIENDYIEFYIDI